MSHPAHDDDSTDIRTLERLAQAMMAETERLTVDQMSLSEADQRLCELESAVAALANTPLSHVPPVPDYVDCLQDSLHVLRSMLANLQPETVDGTGQAADGNALSGAVNRATHDLQRAAYLLPARRRPSVLETQRDLLLAETGVDEIVRRRQFELEDIAADAVRSRFGFKPAASPRIIGAAVVIVVFGAVFGADVTVHFDLSARLAVQVAALPNIAVGGLVGGVLGGLIGGALGWVSRPRKIS
jgi:hypothetical protein